mgnify:CR=1 FL=1
MSPGHFLIGQPLNTLSSASIINILLNRLNTQQGMQRISEQFLKRWQLEYLMQLQHRYKWKHGADNIQVGKIVILHIPKSPPLVVWNLGHIVEVFPG